MMLMTMVTDNVRVREWIALQLSLPSSARNTWKILFSPFSMHGLIFFGHFEVRRLSYLPRF